MMPRKQRIIWGIVYILLVPVPLLFFYGNNIIALVGAFFLLYLAYFIFFKKHSNI